MCRISLLRHLSSSFGSHDYSNSVMSSYSFNVNERTDVVLLFQVSGLLLEGCQNR